jgi:hypothetical protein
MHSPNGNFRQSQRSFCRIAMFPRRAILRKMTAALRRSAPDSAYFDLAADFASWRSPPIAAQLTVG